MADAVRVELADGYTELVAHVLAHVPLDQPGNLYDPRYCAFIGPRLEPESRARLAHDGSLLARCWAADPGLDQLHRMVELHRSFPGFEATCARSLTELQPDEVADPALLGGLRGVPAAELLHTMLALAAPELDVLLAARVDARRALADALLRLRAAVPQLGEPAIEIVGALGVHGRAFPGRVLVGAPAPWNGCTAGRQAILAAHETLVLGAPSSSYLGSEWHALRGLARALRTLDDPELRAAHGDWLASLDLDDLLTALQARGIVNADDADALRREPETRAERLGAARAHEDLPATHR